MDPLGGVLLILALGLPVVVLAHRIGVSSLIAYLLVGYLAKTFFLSEDLTEDLENLGDIGAILLLFGIGLELDLGTMRRELRPLLIGGLLQIGLTALVGFLVAWGLGASWQIAIGIGACLTLSSTLLVMRALDERRLRNRLEGRRVIGLLLTQDLFLAPLIAVVAIVFPGGDHDEHPWWLQVAGIPVFVAFTWFMRTVLASRILHRILVTQLPELEVAFSVFVAIGAGYLSETMGLGEALGAFCAGLALGGGEHRHAIETATRPLMGLMAIIFFTSIGFQFDAGYMIANLPLVIAALSVSLVLKAALAGFAFRLAGMSIRSAVGAGIMVGQIGEFSFVIASMFRGMPGDEGEFYNLIVTVACLSLALTPILVAIASRLLPGSNLDRVREKGNTIVVAGMGPVGNTVVQTLLDLGQKLFLVDRNPRLLEPWNDVGAVTPHLGKIEEMEDWLPALGERPRAVILTFPIADTSALVAERLRTVDPNLIVVARSPYASQVDVLIRAGVQHIICDELETGKALVPMIEEVLGMPIAHQDLEEIRERMAHHTREEMSELRRRTERHSRENPEG